MQAGGWGDQPWGSSTWGGSSTACGWGSQPWGSSGWGCIGVPVQPLPPQIIGDFERFQRVHREPRYKHEPETIRNVLFKIEGVTAEVHLGRPTYSTGYGVAAQVRRARGNQSRAGAVEIQTGTGTSVRAEAIRAACECGEAMAGVSIECEAEGVEGSAHIGITRVRAIRNPTDEEFLMMLAEMI